MNNEIGKIYARPWGTYRTLELTQNYQVKTITINPSGRLSLQKHFHRAEYWIVVGGKPTLTIDTTTNVYNVGDHIFIPIGTLHRMENFTSTPVVIVETQIGNYLGEDDIVRLEDVYGRV